MMRRVNFPVHRHLLRGEIWSAVAVQHRFAEGPEAVEGGCTVLSSVRLEPHASIPATELRALQKRCRAAALQNIQ
jgi:hypothetical protein